MTDLSKRLIYDHATVPAIVYFMLIHTIHPQGKGFFYTLAGAGALLAAGLLMAWISRGAFGGGDIKLLAAAGAALGALNGIMLLAAAFFAAGIVAWPLLLLRWLAPKRFGGIKELPMAPFIAVGAAAALLIDF